MGMTPAPEKCFITDLPTTDLPSSTDAIQYQIVFSHPLKRFQNIDNQLINFFIPYLNLQANKYLS